MSGNRSLDEFAEPDPEEGADGQRTGEGAATAETAAAETADEAASDGAEEAPSGREDAEEPADATPDPLSADSEPVEVEGSDADTEGLDPPASTYIWSPGGGECADCGANVEERWRDGGDLVCTGCKEW